MRMPRRRGRLASLSALVTAALLGAPTGASALPTESYRSDSYECRTSLGEAADTGSQEQALAGCEEASIDGSAGTESAAAAEAGAPAGTNPFVEVDAGVPVWGIGAALGGLVAAVGASAAAWSNIDWTRVLIYLGSL